MCRADEVDSCVALFSYRRMDNYGDDPLIVQEIWLEFGRSTQCLDSGTVLRNAAMFQVAILVSRREVAALVSSVSHGPH